MIAPAVILFAVGAGDLVAALSGRPEDRTRTVAAMVVVSVVGVAGGFAAGFELPVALLLGGVCGVLGAGWLAARRATEEWSPRGALKILLGTAVALLAVLVTSGLWPHSDGGLAGRWVGTLPFPIASTERAEQVLAALGGLVFLQASANALVRLVLRAADTSLRPEATLLGGRIIGPLERSLIFAFALAGEPTAAALIVSAKSLLRFPEIGRSADIAHTTEYFLIGSLTSWTLALALAVLLSA